MSWVVLDIQERKSAFINLTPVFDFQAYTKQPAERNFPEWLTSLPRQRTVSIHNPQALVHLPIECLEPHALKPKII